MLNVKSLYNYKLGIKLKLPEANVRVQVSGYLRQKKYELLIILWVQVLKPWTKRKESTEKHHLETTEIQIEKYKIKSPRVIQSIKT